MGLSWGSSAGFVPLSPGVCADMDCPGMLWTTLGCCGLQGRGWGGIYHQAKLQKESPGANLSVNKGCVINSFYYYVF